MTHSGIQSETTPSLEDAASLVRTGIDDENLVTLFGRCSVDYSGRAKSELGPGDRHVMLKPDGTALVHTDEGHQPVNWQPPGCQHEIQIEDNQLVLESTRTSPDELLVVSFESVSQVTHYSVTDSEELSLSGTEADLKERILEEPGIVSPGFTPLATERSTPAGAVDIYGEDDSGATVVVELKRRRVGPDAVGQLNRYVTALERELHDDAEIRGILVAPSVTDRARQLLSENGLEFSSAEPS